MLSNRLSLSLASAWRQSFSLRLMNLNFPQNPCKTQASALFSRALSSTSSRKRILSEAAQPLSRQPATAPVAFQPIVLQHNDRPGILRMLSAGASAQLVFWLWCAAHPLPLHFASNIQPGTSSMPYRILFRSRRWTPPKICRSLLSPTSWATTRRQWRSRAASACARCCTCTSRAVLGAFL